MNTIPASQASDACSWSESERLAALRAYEILDTPPERAFDDVCQIAVQVCRTPIAVVNLIEDTRQFFKAEIGVGVRETSLDVSICRQAILQQDLVVVPDLSGDSRFACNPLVTGEPHLRFYAGAVLRTSEGLPLGTVCVLDHNPRPQGLTSEQAEVLQALARQVMTLLTHGRLVATLAKREIELEQVQEIAGVGGLEVDLRDGIRNRRSSQYLRIHGLSPDALHETHEDWVQRIHPDDREEVERYFLDAVRGDARDYRAEYRIIRPSDGETRWITAVAKIERDETGRALRLIGAHRDITHRKINEEARELLTRELSHRIKNIFAVVSGLASLTARGNELAQDYVRRFQERLQALALAHEYVRPYGSISNSASLEQTLQGLIRTLLAPYMEDAQNRFVIEGDDVAVGEKAATALALIMHEQATNAVKYGALSTASGRVTISLRCEGGTLLMFWQERGGPSIAGAPQRRGFGTRMSARSIELQLGGEIRHEWEPEGLTMRIAVPVTHLVA
ncbi:PAS domain-containing protein [Methylobacterium aquaticum]|uniref:PAS domain-containing protein n=1 Tax=Methylobacterium aquaticum TaxID=270351 RepID=UPI0009E2B1D3|nr:PAS domain-containing protein [Methylobacterium aquaticum]